MKAKRLRFLKYFLPRHVRYQELQEIVKSIIEEGGTYELTQEQINRGIFGNEWVNTEKNLAAQEVIDILPVVCSTHLRGCARVLSDYAVRATFKTLRIGYYLPGVDTLYFRKVDITRARG